MVWNAGRIALFLGFAWTAWSADLQTTQGISGPWQRTLRLSAGETVEIGVSVKAPSALPPNGRLAVSWSSPAGKGGFRKVLHTLDPDVFTVYRAPVAGEYSLRMEPVEDEDPHFNTPRWREPGVIANVVAFPRKTPWPAGRRVAVRIAVKTVEPASSGEIIEAEPNDSLALAQTLPPLANEDQTLHVTGGADDIEYFDNGAAGNSGDDWFRLQFQGTEPRLLTANLELTDPLVVARLRFYAADGNEFKEGANANERVHQQQEEHRTEINRTLKPGQAYFLRVEANSPGYGLELRVRKPAPYSDPRQAIRQAMYDHLAQVDAWLLNRPRGAAVERRIRDTGSLLGTGCMSCHTQSGVWGVAVPMAMGYRPENVWNLRHLINVMYESLRPTNVLKDAANNTSLPPLDLGDGPAGTRVAGYNVVMTERVVTARKLHSSQHLRTANFVLQSNDPSGINAAGKGSNVGQAVVYKFAGEILAEAHKRTGDTRFLDALHEKAQKMLAVEAKFLDDYAHRVEFFRRTFPADSAPAGMRAKMDHQVAADLKKIRALQRPDGAWGFSPREVDEKPDPAPTALAIAALHASGAGPDDPQIRRAVEWLLKKQDPYGRWNESALTGFVTTAYVLHSLARLYPENPAPLLQASDPVSEQRMLAVTGDPKTVHRMLVGARHQRPHVRYWAMLGLGAAHDQTGVAALIAGLGDPVKMVREAARWGLRQTLLDDKGWQAAMRAGEAGSDRVREQVAAALIMRADAVMPRAAVDFTRLGVLLDRMMNTDPSPAVRAWAARAAWNWWVWNPPIRPSVNQALVKALERPEPSALAENALRYQSQALFIANGQRANGSVDHQYPELAKLFEAISKRLDQSPPQHMVDRIVAAAGTFYNMAGGDGGPGQMGYVTEHSADMAGKAVMAYLARAESAKDSDRIRLSLEAAANATYLPLQEKLLEYATSGPENLRTIAATSVSDPRVISLPGTQEFLEPLMEQVRRGASDPDRRDQLSRPVIRLFNRARWNLPRTEEQQRIFYGLVIPRFENPKDPKANETEWYLAEQLGGFVGSNPDLRTDILLQQLPKSFSNPVEEYFWVPSVSWLIGYGNPIPEVRGPKAPNVRPDLEQWALTLYLKQLDAKVDQRLREAAVRMAFQTELRQNASVRSALEKLNLPNPERYQPEVFDRELEQAVASDKGERMPPIQNEAWRENFRYFRDHVLPEMNTAQRNDEQACFGCHGVAGRVPSMELAAPERRTGWFSARDAWKNFRILLERVNEADVEQSKLLRKPLNVQTGKEDGHQGGRRYNPGDRGYEILRRWVLDAARLRRQAQPAATGL
ncbi:MAG: hypothetical protein ACKV22_27060 [Bryobacteraceae bacterium]